MTYCDGENDDREVMLIEITTQIAEALIKIMAQQCKMTCYDEGHRWTSSLHCYFIAHWNTYCIALQ